MSPFARVCRSPYERTIVRHLAQLKSEKPGARAGLLFQNCPELHGRFHSLDGSFVRQGGKAGQVALAHLVNLEVLKIGKSPGDGLKRRIRFRKYGEQVLPCNGAVRWVNMTPPPLHRRLDVTL